MAGKGINFWAFSTGNEPLNGIIGWFFIHFMSLGWTANEQVGTDDLVQADIKFFTSISQTGNMGGRLSRTVAQKFIV